MAFHHLRPHKRSLINKHPLLDKVVYIAGIISLIMMIPQLRHIFVEKNASGLEPITWLTLAILDIPWIIYGLVHKEIPIVFIYILWLIVNSLIFAGTILY